MQRAAGWIVTVVLVSALGCRGRADDVAPGLPLPPVRPPDFALRFQFDHGSGMQPPVVARVVGPSLAMSGESTGDGTVSIPLAAAQLDAVYAAARGLPRMDERPALRQNLIHLHALRIELVAAQVTHTIVTGQRAADPADYALLDVLKTLVADAVEAPTALPEVRPVDAGIVVGTYDPDRGAGQRLAVSAARSRVWWMTKAGGGERWVRLTPADLDALYGAARAVAAVGLPRSRSAVPGETLSIYVAVGERRFESTVELATIPPAARPRVAALRALVEQLIAGTVDAAGP